MAIYQRITINVSAEDDKLIKQAAKDGGYKSVSAFCRDKILNDTSINQELNKVTIEDKLDRVTKSNNNLEEALGILLEKYQHDNKFFSLLLYSFMQHAADDNTAKLAWEQAVKEMEK